MLMGNWVEPRVNALVPCIGMSAFFYFNNYCHDKDMNHFYGSTEREGQLRTSWLRKLIYRL
ncbi:hypothetical protein EI200_04135 [Peribacillus simplex]|nr:hypothetical protein EI200_04135 [Peribacillus simplex]